MDYGDFSVVLPTLNEERTVGTLIDRLLELYRGIKIVVVDDGSTDGTGRIVSGISKSNRNVVFIDRKRRGKEKGLTASAVEGVMISKTKFAIIMDADLQHPPEKIKEIADALLQNNDIAVATRADVKGWQLHRKFISKSLIVIGRMILVARGRETCSDIFSGFFGIKRGLFSGVYNKNKRRFVGGGYKILFDLLKCIRRDSVNISEIPYHFGLRSYGKSKAGIRQGVLLFKSFVT